MSNTPAAQLARVRVQNPTWHIVQEEDGTYTAWQGTECINRPTIATLELELAGRGR